MRFIVLQTYQIVHRDDRPSEWDVETRGYIYSLLREDAHEIVAYHLHPSGSSRVTTPHLHIGPAIAGTSNQIGQRYIHRMHFPTGLVPLSSIIRLAIEEFGARPLRDDWKQVLVQEGAA
jgi:hypothetical protein